MGCDIHLYVERKVDGKWVTADKWTPDPYADESEKSRLIVDEADCFYSGRNYDLFAMLADVRNGADFHPISEPKGLPGDVSPEVKAESDSWDGDSHSHSWLTFAELKAYNWIQVATRIAVVDVLGFAHFEQHGMPHIFSDGDLGKTVEYISNEEMRERVAKYQPEMGELVSHSNWSQPNWLEFEHRLWAEPVRYYTRVSWPAYYAVSAEEFLRETMPKLEALSFGNPENVRIVFWFDN